jgi:hypothetical protein
VAGLIRVSRAKNKSKKSSLVVVAYLQRTAFLLATGEYKRYALEWGLGVQNKEKRMKPIATATFIVWQEQQPKLPSCSYSCHTPVGHRTFLLQQRSVRRSSDSSKDMNGIAANSLLEEVHSSRTQLEQSLDKMSNDLKSRKW